MSSRFSDVVSALLVDASECDRAIIADHACAYPAPLLERLAAAQRHTVRFKASQESFNSGSKRLPLRWKRGVNGLQQCKRIEGAVVLIPRVAENDDIVSVGKEGLCRVEAT